MEKVKFDAEVSKAIGTSATLAIEIKDIGGFDSLSVDLANAGAVSLVDCYIQKLYHPQASWRSFLGGSDFASLTNPNLEFVSTVKPHTLAGSANSQFTVWITGCIGVRIYLQADTGGTTVNIYANAMKNS